ncbi:MAG: hypothetical protein ACP5OK_00905 [Thermoprotei archaeon]
MSISHKLIIIISLMVIILLATSISILQKHDRNKGLLNITEGSTYVYKLIPNNSSAVSELFIIKVHSLNSHININDVNYYIVLKKDYWKSVSDNIKIINVNASDVGRAVAKDIYIIIKITSIKENSIVTNVTLVMKKGYARFGPDFNPLPMTDTGWNYENGSFSSLFTSLNMSKVLIINRSNNNVKDLAGFNLGEWPFWIKNESKNNFDAVLYGLDNMINVPSFNASKPLSGVATLLILNRSSNAPLNYLVNNINIDREDQIFTEKGLIPSEERIINVTPNEKDVVMNFVKSFIANYSKQETAKNLLKSLIFPVTIEYENNSVIISKDRLSKLLDLHNKPWTYIKDAIVHEYDSTLPLTSNEKSYKVLEFLSGVEYDGRRYITNGFLFLKAVSYEKRSGLLLYITLNDDSMFGPLSLIFPSVITQAFDLTNFAIAKYSEISMQLVSIVGTSMSVIPSLEAFKPYDLLNMMLLPTFTVPKAMDECQQCRLKGK